MTTKKGEDVLKMPPRQHFLKFQCSVPRDTGRLAARMAKRRDEVIQNAAEHLKNLAGYAAKNVEVRAVYAERGDDTSLAQWWDVLVVIGYDGPHNDHTRKLAIERKTFEMDKTEKAFQEARMAGGSPIILSSK